MTDRGPAPVDHPAFDTPTIGGMKPWTCSHWKDGKKFAITLYGTSAEQVLEDNCDALDRLSVDGELAATIPLNDDEAWAVIDAYEKSRRGSP
ncbi:hypothetical protein Q5Y75_05840 [Ruegeria sp. 2205SS24-7]|uniref:hypothetical protein n=1 Tax=Ruegeria discodermiae TaxID=3064389 RepID=UPI002741AB3E|nr:hypothetical protein [Ruegeria sp. 2205SS24-7]MDP5216733.1 hypothetical protein [Ruegeria sp. 2205SS24-7]